MRSFFLAVGVFVFLWGSVFLFTQQLEFKLHDDLPEIAGWLTGWGENRAAFYPPEWAALYLCSAGLVTSIFAVGLPRKTRPLPMMTVIDLWQLPHK
ncbi:MAG: hypothetical protein P8M30_03100 [Planctomycetaceae bacterium]|jgi:hypothetical protein|nr:hypothetical protein [Planctomycetaceae bacterium]